MRKKAQVRLYDYLLLPEEEGVDSTDFANRMNPASLEIVEAMVEPSLASAAPGTHYQFLRTGYFCVDTVESKADALVFNRVVGLRDSWAKVQKNQG